MDDNIDKIITKFETVTKRIIDISIAEIKAKIASLDDKIASIDAKVANIDAKVANIDAKVASLDAKVASLDAKVASLDAKVASLDNNVNKLAADNETAHKKIFEDIARIDRRITSLKSENKEEHQRITKHLDSINSAFIRYETDGTDKIRILFDSDVDRKNHQNIYGHEFKNLHDLIAKNSFRISNLEQHFNNN